MFPYLMTLGRTRDRLARMGHHFGQEFVYVLTGEVLLTTQRDGRLIKHTLSPGDSCLLDAHVPHRFTASSLSPYASPRAQMLAVQWHFHGAATAGEPRTVQTPRPW